MFTNEFHFSHIKSGHNEHTASVLWFIFHTSSNKTSCENSCRCNPYHWSKKGVARCVFDVPVVSPCCWNASPPNPPARGPEGSPASLRDPTDNRLSTLVMLVLLPLQLFVFRAPWISIIWLHFFTLAQTRRIHVGVPPHTFICIYRTLRVQTHSLKNATPLKAWICVWKHTSCIRWMKKICGRSYAFSTWGFGSDSLKKVI